MSMFGLILALLVFVFCFWKFFKKPKNFPPGPSLLPIRAVVKSLIRSKSYIHALLQVLDEWGNQYGQVFGLKFGPIRFVFLQGYPAIRDGLKHPEFLERPSTYWSTLISRGEYGAGFSKGKKSVQLKNFILRIMNAEFRKEKAEARIMTQVKDLLDKLSQGQSQAIQVRGLFNALGVLVVWDVIAGKTSYKPEYVVQKNVDMISGLSILLRSVIGQIAPKLSVFFFPEWSRVGKFSRAVESMHDMFRDVIAEHKATLDEVNPRDLIDAFLIEASKATDSNSCFYGEEGQKDLFGVVAELFTPSGPVIPIYLEWGILYISKFPEVQDRFQREIQSVIGSERPPTLTDMEKMPYSLGVIHELIRRNPALSVLALRYCKTQTEFYGYTIPPNTFIFPDLLAMFMDGGIWKEPRDFRPERFLSEDESCFVKPKEAIPFGGGRRSCPAEHLARNTMFLTLVSIYQKFRTELDSSSKDVPVDMEKVEDFFYADSFKIRLTPI